MKPALVCALAATLLLAVSGCKKKAAQAAEAPAAVPTPATPPAATGSQPTTPAPAAPAPVAATGIDQSKPGASENSPLNAVLTDAVARFRDKHKRLPANWQELVQAGFLKSLPQPPPGVRYAIDPISAMVVELKSK